jgi:hypothetical protein
VISPYARKHFIDHQTLSFDAYLKFIEDDFLSERRLDPKTDGRADPRPDVRETEPILGDLTRDFDFTQPPRPAMLHPPITPPPPAAARAQTARNSAASIVAGTARPATQPTTEPEPTRTPSGPVAFGHNENGRTKTNRTLLAVAAACFVLAAGGVAITAWRRRRSF